MAELNLKNEDDLLRCCTDVREDADKRGMACLALGFLESRAAVPVLLELAHTDDLGLVSDSMRALSTMRCLRATRPLMNIVKSSKREEVRNAAINALGLLRDRRTEKMLREILADRAESECTRSYAAEALIVSVPSDETLASLVEVLKDPSPTIRWSALNTLGLIGDQRVVEAIRTCLSDDAIVPSLPDKATVGSAARDALQDLLSQKPKSKRANIRRSSR